ncbi:MAG: FixH family protein, partial [Vicinamibacteria bacterium]
VSTLPRDAAEVILEAQDEDPLLARWHYGIGRSVMFTSEVKNRWAADWLDWDGYGKFWGQLVRETARRHHGAEVDFKVDRRGNAAEVELSIVDESGRYPRGLEPELRVTGPREDVQTVPLRQTAPGRYRASVPVSISAASPWRFELGAEGLPAEALARSGRTRTIFYPYPDEYRFYPPDVNELEAISRETGGKLSPSAEDIFEVGGERASVPTALAPILIALALIGYLLDIAVRRVPWLWQKLQPPGAP